MVNVRNVEGHREHYADFVKKFPPDKAGAAYVSGGHPENFFKAGFEERELLLRHGGDLTGKSVIDVGCGVGRLTQYLADVGLASYLGTDVVPEVIEDAKRRGRSDFRFALVDGPVIPAPAGSADIVCAFSVITHLLDQETYNLFGQAFAALKPGGVAIFSYADFEFHIGLFKFSAGAYKEKPSLFKCFEPVTLNRFATMAGFTVVETHHGKAELPISGRYSSYLDGTPAPATYALGQHVLVLRKPVASS